MVYFMRRNHANRIPEHHIVVDASTVGTSGSARPGESRHRLHVGSAVQLRRRSEARENSNQYDFRTAGEWWSWLRACGAKGRRVWVWAANAPVVFTALGLWREIEDGSLRFRAPRREEADQGLDGQSRPHVAPSLITSPWCFLADLVDERGAAFRFVGLENWLGQDLAKIAESLNLELASRPGDAGEEADWLACVRSRVAVGSEAVARICSIVKECDLGNMSFTAGGQAMAHYRHRHLKADITIGPDDRIRPLERSAYHGARQCVYFCGAVQSEGTEVFLSSGGGKQPPPTAYTRAVYRLDVNQCYPFVMGRHLYPVRLYRRAVEPSTSDVVAAMVHYEAVASVRLYSEVEPYPVRVPGRTVWRVGTVHAALCGPELRRALASGHVMQVHEVQYYVRDMLFTSWSDEMVRLRSKAKDSGDIFQAKLLKRLANSLHGKFGQSGRRWEDAPNVRAVIPWGAFQWIDPETETVHEARAIDGRSQLMGREPDAQGACPIIAAYVTSHAREHMRMLRLCAGPREVYYEDADSLHVSQAGYDNLGRMGHIHPSRPGGMKVEAVADVARYVGPKHYQLGDVEVVAGHAKAGHYDADGLYHQADWVGMDSLLAAGVPECPISVDRSLRPAISVTDEGYGPDGWVIYRRQ